MEAVFKRFECLPFGGSYEAIVSVTQPLTGASSDLQCVIDTGFSGSIMLESDSYRKLGLDLTEAASSQFPVFKSLMGSIILRSSHAKARLGGVELDVEILTPVYGPGKNLVGRKFLREFTTLLYRDKKACVGEAQVEV